MTKDPFEKWNYDQKSKFVMDFKSEYNKVNNESYQVEKNSFEDKEDYDFSLYKKGKILKVQHTFTGAESEKEYVKPKLGDSIIKALIQKTQDLGGIQVHLNFHNPPKEEKYRNSLIHHINHFIRAKTRSLESTSLFSYTPDDLHYIDIIRKNVNDFLIKPINEERVVFSWSTSEEGSCAVLSEDIRFDMALEKKKKYSDPQDIVLIIDFNIFGFKEDDYYLPLIKKKNKNSEFSELWIHNGWGSEFFKVK